jgi:hypothetical protein
MTVAKDEQLDKPRCSLENIIKMKFTGKGFQRCILDSG